MLEEKLIFSFINSLAIVKCQDDYEKLIESIEASEKAVVVSFVNAHAFNLVYQNEELRDVFLKSNFLLRDGIGIEVLLRILGVAPGFNMNGTDFIPKLLERFKGRRMAVIGTQSPWLDTACKRFVEDGHNVVMQACGFRENDFYIDSLVGSGVELVLLGMGMPIQEKLAVMLQDKLDDNCIVICGGAIIDFLAARHRRAPKWMRQIGLEWFFRLCCEPRRLFKRYAYGNFIFMCRVFQLFIGKNKK